MADKAINENVLSEYLLNNTTLKICEAEHMTNINITKNDDMWLVQCSKDINVSQLKGQKIKLPGKSNYDILEAISEEFDTCKKMPLAVNNLVHNIPVEGNVVVRKTLKNVKIEDIEIPTSKKGVPFPEHLKERHPLLGSDYHDKIVLSNKILEQLQRSKELSAKVFKSRRGNSKDFIANGIGPASVEIKTEKRKRKGEDRTEDRLKAKRNKFSEEGEINQDLVWIKDL